MNRKKKQITLILLDAHRFSHLLVLEAMLGVSFPIILELSGMIEQADGLAEVERKKKNLSVCTTIGHANTSFASWEVRKLNVHM